MATEEQVKAVSGVLDKRTPKKHSVRFETDAEDAPLDTVYVPKDVLKQLDRLDGGAIRITIEAA